MKTLATIILAAVLTACGSGQSDWTTVASDMDARAITQTAQREPIAPVVAEPLALVRAVDPELIEPVMQTTCDLTTYNPCAIEPVAPPVVVCSPSTRGCVAPDVNMELCDLWSYNPCATPTWVYKRPVAQAQDIAVLCQEGRTCEVTPVVICTRDSRECQPALVPVCLRGDDCVIQREQTRN